MGTGKISSYGDLNGIYNQAFYKVDPPYQLIIVGVFPNARYFSITVYDDHQAVSQNIPDTNVVEFSRHYTCAWRIAELGQN
jgi:hypothetical protein